MNGDKRADVVIAGGGFAGLALAVAVRDALGPRFGVIVADPKLADPHPRRNGERPDLRASAIAAAPRRMFEALGVWPAVAEEAQPILEMVVTDSRLEDVLRPTFLSFAGEVEPDEPFAHMVENGRLDAALAARATAIGVDIVTVPVQGFVPAAQQVAVDLADGTTIAAKLLVAADGARSRLREQAGIATHGWSYGQAAIVTTVGHERDHGGRAEEHFLPAGPFAILPLRHNRCSIVWTERAEEADRLVALPDAQFLAELERRFGLRLGEITVVGGRATYPLGLWVARRFIADRLALIGDAAHAIHPIAGQGLNMSLRDAAALAEAIVDAVRLGLDPGGMGVLERYQRWRRFDTLTMSISTDVLNRLFSNRSDGLRLARDLGLGLVDRLPGLKRLFIREAAGLVGSMPKLLRGQAL